MRMLLQMRGLRQIRGLCHTMSSPRVFGAAFPRPDWPTPHKWAPKCLRLCLYYACTMPVEQPTHLEFLGPAGAGYVIRGRKAFDGLAIRSAIASEEQGRCHNIARAARPQKFQMGRLFYRHSTGIVQA